MASVQGALLSVFLPLKSKSLAILAWTLADKEPSSLPPGAQGLITPLLKLFLLPELLVHLTPPIHFSKPNTHQLLSAAPPPSPPDARSGLPAALCQGQLIPTTSV